MSWYDCLCDVKCYRLCNDKSMVVGYMCKFYVVCFRAWCIEVYELRLMHIMWWPSDKGKLKECVEMWNKLRMHSKCLISLDV